VFIVPCCPIVFRFRAQPYFSGSTETINVGQ
jgi:hypothetical protein